MGHELRTVIEPDVGRGASLQGQAIQDLDDAVSVDFAVGEDAAIDQIMARERTHRVEVLCVSFSKRTRVLFPGR